MQHRTIAHAKEDGVSRNVSAPRPRRKQRKRTGDESLLTVVVHVILYTLFAIFIGLFLFVLRKTWATKHDGHGVKKTLVATPPPAVVDPQQLRPRAPGGRTKDDAHPNMAGPGGFP